MGKLRHEELTYGTIELEGASQQHPPPTLDPASYALKHLLLNFISSPVPGLVRQQDHNLCGPWFLVLPLNATSPLLLFSHVASGGDQMSE